MFEIRKATLADIPLINRLAWIVFPHTYKELLSPEQIEFMMEWMYSPTNLEKQMTEEGHIYYLAFQGNEPAGYLSIQPEAEHIYHLQKIYVLPSFQGMRLGMRLFQQAIDSIKELHPAPCQMRLNVNRQNQTGRRRLSYRPGILHERLYHGTGHLKTAFSLGFTKYPFTPVTMR